MARRMLRVTYTRTVHRSVTYEDSSAYHKDRAAKQLREAIGRQVSTGVLPLETLSTLTFEDIEYPPAVRIDDDPDEDADDDR